MLPVISLFFVGGPDSSAIPSIRHAWNIGHTAFFFVVTLIYQRYRPFKSQLSVFTFIAAIFAISFVIEISQSFIGRSFSTIDILRNLTGVTFACWLRNRSVTHPSLLGIFALIFCLDITGLVFKIQADYRIQNRAPIIENFEMLSSMSFWKSEIDFRPDQNNQDNNLGYIGLEPGNYSGSGMANLLKDWSAYQTFNFKIYLPGSKNRQLTVRIHDLLHDKSRQLYNDRFNRSLQLQPGWNSVSIPLSLIREAPNNRELDLTQIKNVSFFFVDLDQPITIMFDDIELGTTTMSDIQLIHSTETIE